MKKQSLCIGFSSPIQRFRIIHPVSDLSYQTEAEKVQSPCGQSGVLPELTTGGFFSLHTCM